MVIICNRNDYKAFSENLIMDTVISCKPSISIP